MGIRIERAPAGFSDWTDLLRLLKEAYAFMDGRIDPPSSVHGLTPTSVAHKSRDETLLLATDTGDLVGCVFARQQSGALYVSKLAVRKDRQRQGIGRRLMAAAEEHARELGLAALELETRLELTENHETFAALGFLQTSECAHEGYDHPTFIRMRKPLVEREGEDMSILTADMRRVVAEQRLGFVATVCPDGTPNLSPKGTTAVWDDDHLVFANIRSPGTLANLRQNPHIEINVVDPIVRKGYRFKGVATLLESGPRYDEAVAFYRKRGLTSAIREIVLVSVRSASAIDSPAYDLGLSEAEVRARWEDYWRTLRAGKTSAPPGE